MELTFQRKPINVRQLETEMRGTFSTKYTGLSTDGENIRFFFDELTGEDMLIVKAIYDAHVPTETEDQADARRKTAKATLRNLLRQFKRGDVRSLTDALPYLEALVILVLSDD